MAQKLGTKTKGLKLDTEKEQLLKKGIAGHAEQLRINYDVVTILLYKTRKISCSLCLLAELHGRIAA